MDCLGLTKRWSLYVASTATPGFVFWTILTDLRQAEFNPLLTGSVRAVAWARRAFLPALEAPLRATCSKSQPPHLVFGYFYYCLLNLSSDHLLSGVSADYRGMRAASIGLFPGIRSDNKNVV